MLENRAQVCTSSYTAADKYFETWQELTRQILTECPRVRETHGEGPSLRF